MEAGIVCCLIMETFLQNSGCTPTFRNGYVAACDGVFREAVGTGEDDPAKQVQFCPWCGRHGSWSGDQWLPS